MRSLKTTAYRKELRQLLEKAGWRECRWASKVLAAECVQGWAGRKNPTGATMLHVYCTQYPSTNNIQSMAKFLQDAGVPPFNLVPIRDYAQAVKANRLPQRDTQDRFWLLRSYTALSQDHWDHWSLTKLHWGGYFQPSAHEAVKIMKDPILFDTMLIQDWSRQEYHEEPSYWEALVSRYHSQWPDYCAMVQMLASWQPATFNEFRSAHLSFRAKYFDPQTVESFDLP